MRRLALAACILATSCAPRPTTSEGVAPGGWDDEKHAAGEVAEVSPPPEAAVSTEPRDFGSDVRVLYRVVACAGDEPLPRNVNPAIVDTYCKDLEPKIAAYRRRYVSVAQPFLVKLPQTRPPERVVYPFSGGDLVTALTTYPDAREITTVSLELAGDPRRIGALRDDALSESLMKLRFELEELIAVDDYSKSETLKHTQRGDIPDELAFFLVGLAVHGYEPLSLRYFTVDAVGEIHYLSGTEIDSMEGSLAERRKTTWIAPDFSEAFASSEITFREIGDSSAPVRVHRHIAANLSNDGLRDSPGLLAHLSKKGDVAAMTKAASYLLWLDAFSEIRDYLAKQAVVTISDSTGIPADLAAAAGLSQRTYGTFTRSLLRENATHNAAMKKLWDTQPKRQLPFRYGYKDGSGHDHLMVTERAAPRG